MSLTSFVGKKEVREKIRAAFEKPRLTGNAKLLAPPKTKRYALTGMAFDYLLRFHAQRENPFALERPWPAEEGLKRLRLNSGFGLTDLESSGSIHQESHDFQIGEKIHLRARRCHDQYLRSGKVTKALLESAIGLAKLEVIYRSGYVDENLLATDPADISDLRELLSIIPAGRFKAERLCLLNPSFGIGSEMLHGADADLVLDDTLVEIKTTKSNKMRSEHWDQLIGYLALHEIWGLDGPRRKPKISKLAVYSSRFGEWSEFEVNDLIGNEDFSEFLTWFRGAVEHPFYHPHEHTTQRSRD